MGLNLTPTTTSTPHAATFLVSSKHSQDPQVSKSEINSSRSEFSEGPRGKFWASSDTHEEGELKALQVIDPAYRTKETKGYWARGPGHPIHRTYQYTVTTQEDIFWELPDHPPPERLQPKESESELVEHLFGQFMGDMTSTATQYAKAHTC